METLYDILSKYFAGKVLEQLLLKDKEKTVVVLKRIAKILKSIKPQYYNTVRKLIVGLDRPLNPIWLKFFIKWLEKSMIPNYFAPSLLPNQSAVLYKSIPLDFVIVTITTNCNLRCKHCYQQTILDNPCEMSFETALSLLQQVQENDVYTAVLTGGEPTLWPYFFDLIRSFPDIFFAIWTNGLTIDENFARQAAKLGNCSFAISVEGLREYTDAIRGDGVFERVQQTFSLLRHYGVFFGFQFTLMRYNENVALSPEFLNSMIKAGCAFGIYYLYTPVSSEDDCSQIPDFETTMTVWENIKTSIRLHDIVLDDFRFDAYFPDRCLAAGRRFINITVDGYVEPCPGAHYATHNINTSSLKQIMDSEFFKMLRKGFTSKVLNCTPCTVNYSQISLDTFKKSTGAISTFPIADKENVYLAKVLEKYHYALRTRHPQGAMTHVADRFTKKGGDINEARGRTETP